MHLDKLDADKMITRLKQHGEIGDFLAKNMRIIRSVTFEKLEDFKKTYTAGVRMK